MVRASVPGVATGSARAWRKRARGGGGSGDVAPPGRGCGMAPGGPLVASIVRFPCACPCSLSLAVTSHLNPKVFFSPPSPVVGPRRATHTLRALPARSCVGRPQCPASALSSVLGCIAPRTALSRGTLLPAQHSASASGASSRRSLAAPRARSARQALFLLCLKPPTHLKPGLSLLFPF